MRGWLFTRTHMPLKLTEKPDPVAGPGQVVVDIKATGLCLSDIHVLEDEYYMKIATGAPCYIGHECAGVVESVGDGVTCVKPGDRVAVDNVIDAATNQCIGFTRDGGYASKVLAQDYQCVHMPDEVTFAEAASATCGGKTAYHSVFVQGGAKPGMKVGFIGIGGVGQYAVGMAAAVGCEVYASSRSEKGKRIALELGAKEAATSITEFTDKDLDLIVDFAGARRTLNDAIHTVRYGGTIVIVGMMENDIVIENANSLDSLILKELSLKGCSGGPASELTSIFNIIKTGKYRPQLETIRFDDIEDGIDRLRKGKVEGKLVAVQE